MATPTTASLSFADKPPFYIGIDVHKNKWSVTIRHNNIHVTTHSMNPKPAELAKHMNKHFPNGHYKSVYEAGFCGFWIHRELIALGIENIVTNAADVPTSQKEKITKTDAVDSNKLARELENDNLEALYVPTEEQEQLRSVCRLQKTIGKELARTRTRIKSHLAYFGIEAPKALERSKWSRAYMDWLDTISVNNTMQGYCLSELVDEVRRLEAKRKSIIQNLIRLIKDSGLKEQFEYLLSIPGVAEKTAITLMTEIIDMKRFKTNNELCSYVGIIPSTYSSGETHREQGLCNRKNRYLRYMIIESAWVAVRTDPALLEAFSSLTKRMKKTQAIIRIARKLLSRIRYVWLNNTGYERGLKQVNVTA